MAIADMIQEVLHSYKCGAEQILEDTEKALGGFGEKGDRFMAEETLRSFKTYIQILQCGVDRCEALLERFCEREV